MQGAPEVEILSPEDATEPDEVYDATLDVSCKVTASEAAGAAPPDPATVTLELLDGDELIESQAGVHPEPRGALTQGYLGGVMFELVHDERP